MQAALHGRKSQLSPQETDLILEKHQLLTPGFCASGVQVSASAPTADSDTAGLLQIRIAADDAAAADVVAALAAGVIKGALPGGAALQGSHLQRTDIAGGWQSSASSKRIAAGVIKGRPAWRVRQYKLNSRPGSGS